APLNKWSEVNKDRIQRFLLQLTDVSDFYESLELDQYVALSKRDLKITITTNEVYAMHAILAKHRDAVCPPGSHLDQLLAELGVAPAQVPRALSTHHSLPLFSRWETEIADSDMLIKTQTETSASEALYLDAKSEFVHLLRRVPALLPRTGPLELTRVAELAIATAAHRDPMVGIMAQRALDMLAELERLGVVRRRDNYRILADEVAAELVHLGNLKAKVVSEAGSLETVYRTICEHNEYLSSQLDTYKAYLANVRMQTTGSLATADPPKHEPSTKAFAHAQLEKDGVIVESNVPEQRRPNISVGITCPSPGSFLVSLDYKGRDRPILEMDLRLDDLLEKQHDGVLILDLEYVQLSVPKLVALLNKHFLRSK
ncbi:putative GTPase-activating protein, partial [Catenaria anguillulae PL171]